MNFIPFCVLRRSFINILHNIAQKYSNITLNELRSLEKIKVKLSKSLEELQFLKNCKSFNVSPKFITFELPNVCGRDVIGKRKKLLRSATLDQNKKLKQLEEEATKYINNIQRKVSSLD